MPRSGFRIIVDQRAMDFLADLPRKIQKKLQGKIDSLKDDPRPPGTETLRGHKNLCRIRSGDYRIIYTVHDRKVYVYVIMIGHRKDVYDQILRYFP